MKKFINGKMINLAEPRLGSKVIFKTDDFFASASRIINPNPPIFKEGVFDKHGKWMDGWETRRRRKKGFDYVIVKLGRPGKIFNADIDTTHFSGNQPMQASLEACHSKKNPNNKSRWITILSKKKLGPNKNHNFKIKNKSIFTHIKLNIYPDGGVARLRVYGEVEMKKVNFGNKIINLSSMLNGSSIVGCNNEHFGRLKIFSHQVKVKIWVMDGKLEEVEEKILIGLFLNVLQKEKFQKFKLTLIILKEIIQINARCKLHI